MGIGLALSGGGYRATLFHLGVINCLKATNSLARVSHICSVSGGSITAAHLVLNWERYMSDNPETYREVVKELTEFISNDIRTDAVNTLPRLIRRTLVRRLLPIRKSSEVSATPINTLINKYQKLFKATRLSDLKKNRPHLYILATELTNGELIGLDHSGLIRCSTRERNLKEVGVYPATDMPIANAVAASSAFPALFNTLDVKSALFNGYPNNTIQLSDGGIIDNIGICFARIRFKEITEFIVCDAGKPFGEQHRPAFPDFSIEALLRSIEIMQYRIAILQGKELEPAPSYINPTYISIQDVYDTESRRGLPAPMAQAEIPFVRTDFDTFSPGLSNTIFLHGFYAAAKSLSPDKQLEADSPYGRIPPLTPDEIKKESHSNVSLPIFTTRSFLSLLAVILLLVIGSAAVFISHRAFNLSQPPPPLDETLSLSNYEALICPHPEVDIRSDLKKVSIGNDLKTSGKISAYRFSWVIAHKCVLVIRHYKLTELSEIPDLKIWSNATIGSDKMNFLFARSHDQAEFKPIPIDAGSTSFKNAFRDSQGVEVAFATLYKEKILDGNYLLMDVDKFLNTPPFQFDVSIAKDQVAPPGPFLHDVIIPQGFTSVGDVRFKPRKFFVQSHFSKSCLALLAELAKPVKKGEIEKRKGETGYCTEFTPFFEDPLKFGENSDAFNCYTNQSKDVISGDITFVYYRTSSSLPQ